MCSGSRDLGTGVQVPPVGLSGRSPHWAHPHALAQQWPKRRMWAKPKIAPPVTSAATAAALPGGQWEPTPHHATFLFPV